MTHDPNRLVTPEPACAQPLVQIDNAIALVAELAVLHNERVVADWGTTRQEMGLGLLFWFHARCLRSRLDYVLRQWTVVPSITWCVFPVNTPSVMMRNYSAGIVASSARRAVDFCTVCGER